MGSESGLSTTRSARSNSGPTACIRFSPGLLVATGVCHLEEQAGSERGQEAKQDRITGASRHQKLARRDQAQRHHRPNQNARQHYRASNA